MQPSEHTATSTTQTAGLRRVMGFGDVVLYFITEPHDAAEAGGLGGADRKSTRLNSSH